MTTNDKHFDRAIMGVDHFINMVNTIADICLPLPDDSDDVKELKTVVLDFIRTSLKDSPFGKERKNA